MLKDEIGTALLDIDSVTYNTLKYVMTHVSESKGRASCMMDVISLNFVFGSIQSHDKFITEFAKLKIPNYKLMQEDDLYYLAKDTCSDLIKSTYSSDSSEVFEYPNREMTKSQIKYNEHLGDILDIYPRDMDEIGSQPSDMSSVSGSVLGTDCTGKRNILFTIPDFKR